MKLSFLTDNLGLWERNGEDYINLYLYKGELFFSEIQRCEKGSLYPEGTYVLIGKCEFRKMRDLDGDINKIGLFYLSGYYYNVRIGFPIKKIKIYKIIDHARRVAQLTQPAFIGPKDREGYYVGLIYHTIERLACKKDSIDSYVQQCPLKRYSLEKFLRKDARIYGNEILKRCYLNPFEFEKDYPEIIKGSREKKWWQIYQIRRD